MATTENDDDGRRRQLSDEAGGSGDDQPVRPPSKRPRSPDPSASSSVVAASSSSSSSVDVPTTSHYEVSYMHRSICSCVASSSKVGYVLTASDDGVVKFWKRVSATSSSSSAPPSSGTGSGDQDRTTPHRCLEFVKSYSAHVGPVQSLIVSPSGDSAVSVGIDGVVKLYDVGSFDVVGMIRTKPTGVELGRRCSFLGKDEGHVAIVSSSPEKTKDGASTTSKSYPIYVYSTTTLSPTPVAIVRLHAAPITAMSYNPKRNCMISGDSSGVLDLWDCTVLGSTSVSSDVPEAEAVANDDEDEQGRDGEGGKKNDKTTVSTSSPVVLGVGSPPTPSRNSVSFHTKLETDLYEFLKKKTFCVSIAVSPTGTHFACYGRDRKIRLYEHKTCKIVVTYDERSKVYDRALKRRQERTRRKNGGGGGGDDEGGGGATTMDAIEYGKRDATEREMDDTTLMTGGAIVDDVLPPSSDDDGPGRQLIAMDFDPTGRYLLLPTLLGIKIIEWRTNRVVGIAGKADAASGGLRFVTAISCPGDAKVDRQMELARSGGSSVAINHDAKKTSDALMVCLAYKKRRLYVFSHFDPIETATRVDEEDGGGGDGGGTTAVEEALSRRDVLNEPPDADDMLVSDLAGAAASEQERRLGSEAILRTTMGDIHFKLFSSYVPKTVENFCTHSRNGYYDDVIFHRVIKGFMLQTGDPLGDGTGGESVWGGEFEDEFVRDLRHDRPFTVSMANAGPNTNGSQFFITTVPTPWLDNKHTVFGRVTRGMDVCSNIEHCRTDDSDRPLEDIKIMSVDIL